MRIAFFENQKGVMKAVYSLTAVVMGLMLAQATLGLAFRTQYRDVEWIAVGLCDLGDRRRSSVALSAGVSSELNHRGRAWND
jgi:hypothetical protein